MMRKSVLLLTLIIIVAGLLTMACIPPPAHCSPGFWKNKGHKIYGPYDRTDLYARGPGSDEIRHAAAAELNADHTDADMYCE